VVEPVPVVVEPVPVVVEPVPVVPDGLVVVLPDGFGVVVVVVGNGVGTGLNTIGLKQPDVATETPKQNMICFKFIFIFLMIKSSDGAKLKMILKLATKIFFFCNFH
jgi:hypothetical protein